jgi:integrase
MDTGPHLSCPNGLGRMGLDDLNRSHNSEDNVGLVRSGSSWPAVSGSRQGLSDSRHAKRFERCKRADIGVMNQPSSELTTVSMLEGYWKVHWSAFSPSTRSKTRGRLIIMAASLIKPPRSARSIVHALRRSPTPSSATLQKESTEFRAARHLQGEFLPRCDSVDVVGQSSGQIRIADWSSNHSILANDISDEDLIQLRIDLGGKTYQTRRIYWAGIEAVLHWGIATGRLDRDPSIGLPKVKRIVALEQLVPDRVPEEGEIWELAMLGRSLIDEGFAVAVLLGGYGALRVGEVVALTSDRVRAAESGGLWLTIATQRRRFAKRHSDDGCSSSDYAPPKGRIAGPNARRRCYIPRRVAEEIAPYLAERPPGGFLFVNSSGRALDTSAFRARWDRVVSALPSGHRLEGITPHSLRHAGMSMWLRKGVDLKLIQNWGGWHSLKVMLDTYAALLPGAEEDSIALLEGRRSLPGTVSFPSASDSTPRSPATSHGPGNTHWSLEGQPWSG